MFRPIITTALGVADVALDVVCVLRVYQLPYALPWVPSDEGLTRQRTEAEAADLAVNNGLALADAIRGLIGGGR